MLTILLVSPNAIQFNSVKDCFVESGDAKILETDTVDVALQVVKEIGLDLVIVAEQLDTMNGIEFINTLVNINPLIHTALVSSLDAEDFHEQTEGLGVLMQLPPEAEKKAAEELLEKVEKIESLMHSPQLKEVIA